MKKLLLTLGTVAAVAAPVASVIACGSSNETSFNEASTEQEAALKNLGDNLGTNLDSVTGTLSKTEINGNEVRFTYSPDSSDDSTTVDAGSTVGSQIKQRLTFDLVSKDFIKFEIENDGKFIDATNEKIKTDFANVAQSLDDEFKDAKTALDAVKPTVDKTTGTTTGKTVNSIVTEGVLQSRPTPTADHTTTDIVNPETKAKVLAEIAGLKYVGETSEANGDKRYFFAGTTTELTKLADGSHSTATYAVRMDDHALTPEEEAEISAVLTVDGTQADASAWAAEGSDGTKFVVAGLNVLSNHKITNVVSWIK